MKRRSFLLAAGAIATLPLIPRIAQDVWTRVATDYPPAGGLDEAQLALVAAVADTIVPRTGTPGASDVGVPAWVNVMVTGYFTSAERAKFLAGLAAIDALAIDTNGAPLAMSPSDHRERVIAILDRPNAYERFVARLAHSDRFTLMMTKLIDRGTYERLMISMAQRAHAYSKLKELVVHGYFTSERVQKEVLKVEIIPRRFDGAALMPEVTVRHSQ